MAVETSSNKSAPLWRRFAALIYDTLIILALWMLATALALPLTQGEAIDGNNHLYQFYLLVVAMSFYIGFWRVGGQTLGMRAWHIKLVNLETDEKPKWSQLGLRAIVAMIGGLLLGLSYFWSLFDADRLCLQDRSSKTQIILTR